jgi:IS5 family transposase
MENRNGLLVDFQVTTATGTAERDVLPQLLDDARVRGFHPTTLGADKSYDTSASSGCEPGASHHTSTNTPVAVAVQWTGARFTRPGTTPVRKWADEFKKIFGWRKSVGGFRRARYCGLERVDFAGYLVAAAYRLVRLVRLTSEPSLA